MRKMLLCSVACLLMFASCKENHSLVIRTASVPPADTSYTISPVPAPQVRNVLVEEFTGASCDNCPAGHEILAGLKLESPYNTTLHIIGMHPTNYPQADPESGAAYDFRTQIGYSIETQVYGGLSFMPSAGVDRFAYSGALLLSRNVWGTAIAARAALASTVNLAVTSSYTPSTDSPAIITVTISYPATTAPGQNLSLAIVEDSLIDIQDSSTILVPNYVFNNVFRDMVTSNTTSGDALLASFTSIPAGTVDVRRYNYTVNQGIDSLNNKVHVPQHCRVIAFVTDNTTQQVLQSAECPLVQ